MTNLELVLLHFEWGKRVLLSEHPDIDTITFPEGTTKDQWVTRYLLWSVYHGGFHTFGTPEPVALILIRRLDLAKLEHYRNHYLETIFEQDEDGDVTFVDFAYAPSNYPFIIKFLQSRGTEFIGWTHSHTGKLYIKASADMPANGMSDQSGSLSSGIHLNHT